MTELGFDILPGEHPIVPVMIGDEVDRSALRRAAREPKASTRSASRSPSFRAARRGSARRCRRRTRPPISTSPPALSPRRAKPFPSRAPSRGGQRGNSCARGCGFPAPAYGRSTTSSAVPLPGAVRSVNAPPIAAARWRMFRSPCAARSSGGSKPAPSSRTVDKPFLAPMADRHPGPAAHEHACERSRGPSCTIRNTSICSSGARRTPASICSSTSSFPSAVRKST